MKATILEANMSQTVASASTSLATGTIFTIPALFLWGLVPPYLQVVTLASSAALLGLAAMIPLRRLLIVKAHDELPYPEGTACAEVLHAMSADAGGATSSSAWIFRGMVVGAAVKLAISLAFLIPGEVHAALPVLPKAQLALEIAPALLGVGYILGYRQAGGLCRRRVDFGGRDHSADRLARCEPVDAALPRDSQADLRHGRRCESGHAMCATSVPARWPRRASSPCCAACRP